MRRLKKIILVLFILPHYAVSQQSLLSIDNTVNSELEIGDKCPDVLLNDITGKAKSNLRLSDIKNKLVIINFWSIGCLGCIKTMPKMDSLQKEYIDKIVIIPIHPVSTSNKMDYELMKNKINNYWKKNSFLSKSTLPVVIDSTIFKKIGAEGVPLEMWVDKDGIIKAITGTEYVTKRNIELALRGIYPASENIIKIKFDNNKHLLEISPQVTIKPEALYYSAVTKYLPRVRTMPLKIKIDTLTKQIRVVAINVPILHLYQKTLIYDSILNYPNRFIYEVKDISKYSPKYRTSYLDIWMKENAICYEAIINSNYPNEAIYKYIRDDLNKYLNLNGRIEKRMSKCNLIIRGPNFDMLNRISFNSGVKSLRILDIVKYYNNIENSDPMIDETGITTNIYLPIENLPFNIRDLDKLLRMYNLEVKSTYREIEMFVITEK